jgi:hypothetical protein
MDFLLAPVVLLLVVVLFSLAQLVFHVQLQPLQYQQMTATSATLPLRVVRLALHPPELVTAVAIAALHFLRQKLFIALLHLQLGVQRVLGH